MKGVLLAGTLLLLGCHTDQPQRSRPASELRPQSGYVPDRVGVLHDDVRHVTCWIEESCPGYGTTIRATKYIYVLNVDRSKPANVIKAKVRKFVPVNSGNGEGFTVRTQVLSEAEMRSAWLSQRRVELRGWCDSVPDIEEFAEIRAAIVKWLDRTEPRDVAAE